MSLCYKMRITRKLRVCMQCKYRFSIYWTVGETNLILEMVGKTIVFNCIQICGYKFSPAASALNSILCTYTIGYFEKE